MATQITYNRPPLFPYQTDLIDCPARFTCCEASTKVGKTASHIVWLFEQALQCVDNPTMRREVLTIDGDRVVYIENKDSTLLNQSVWWVAPTHAQAKIAFDRTKHQINDKSFFTVNETNLVITLKTGAKLHFKTGEKPDNLYGDDVYAVVVDEASRCRSEVWTALRTTVTSTGGKIKLIGNVKGNKNWFHKLCMKAKSGEDANYKYFKITAYDAAAAGMMTKDGRPFIEEIEEAKRDLTEAAFRELYLAEATEEGSNPFGMQFIRMCTYPMSSQPSICYGIDLAKKMDWFVTIGLDRNGATSHYVRFQKDWKQTTEEILNLPPAPVALDSTGVGDPIGEDVASKRDDVELFIFTERTRQQLLEGLALAIQKRLISFPEGQITTELENFEFISTRTGVKYAAPAGDSDDCVMALALAWHKWQTASVRGQYSWGHT